MIVYNYPGKKKDGPLLVRADKTVQIQPFSVCYLEYVGVVDNVLLKLQCSQKTLDSNLMQNVQMLLPGLCTSKKDVLRCSCTRRALIANNCQLMVH